MREEKEAKHKHEFMIEQKRHRTEGGKEKEKSGGAHLARNWVKYWRTNERKRAEGGKESERRKRSETQARIYDRSEEAQNRRRKRKREERGSAPRKELGEILESE